MDPLKLLNMGWPHYEGETLTERFRNNTNGEALLDAFVKRWEKADKIDLDSLIRFGSHKDVPTVMLVDAVQQSLLEKLGRTATTQQKVLLHVRVQRSLGLFPHWLWAQKIWIDQEGKVTTRLNAHKLLSEFLK